MKLFKILSNKAVTYFGFVIVSTIWATIAFIMPDFLDNPIDGSSSLLTIILYILIIGGASFWLLMIATIQRHIAAVFLPLFALTGSTVAYFRIAFHATITPVIIEVTLQTNPAEAASVISWYLVAYCILNVAIASLLIWWRWRIGKIAHSWIIAGIALGGLLLYYNCNSRVHQSINQRYPYNIVYNMQQYMHIQRTKSETRMMPPAVKIASIDEDMKIVVIIGEAIRADHLSINGYQRPTTPKLSKQANLINLGDVYSIHTHTSASIPHILTPADSLHPEYATLYESFVPYLADVGFQTSWIGNQDVTESYSHMVYSTDTTYFPNSEKSVYVFHNWDDMDLLPSIIEYITPTRAQLCIVHTIGAHWYYDNHVRDEAAIFQPTTTNRVITNNDSISIVNSYDNCIVTMDMFVDSVCTILKNQNAILIYQSDHGESLGENGVWLHAAGAEDTKHPAGFIWYSDTFGKLHPQLIEQIEQMSQTHLQTDYLFPLVMHIAGLELQINNE